MSDVKNYTSVDIPSTRCRSSVGKFVFLSERGWFDGFQDCNLTMTSEDFFFNDVAFALPKNSWYTDIFSER